MINREYGRLLRRSGEAVVNIIAADGIVSVAYGDYIDTIAWGESYMPVILGHSRDNIIMGEMPVGTNVGVLNPYIGVFGSNWNVHHRILYEDGWLRFAPVMHYLPLVVDDILNRQC